MINYVTKYLDEGSNCSQSILKAASKKYKFKIDKQLIESCKMINGGFGIGVFCTGIVACLMIFGMLFDENKAKSLRITLLSDFKEKYKTFDCCKLCKTWSCFEIISFVTNKTDELINTNINESTILKNK